MSGGRKLHKMAFGGLCMGSRILDFFCILDSILDILRFSAVAEGQGKQPEWPVN